MNKKSKILITGSAGFIGFHLVSRLLEDAEFEIVGLDVINDYYDVNLKYMRLEEHGIQAKELPNKEIVSSSKNNNYKFIKADIADHNFIVKFMDDQKFDYVVNFSCTSWSKNIV